MSYGVDTQLVEDAREIAGVVLRSHTERVFANDPEADKQHSDGWEQQQRTADRRTAIDYLMGCNRTTQAHYDTLDKAAKDIARAAVLLVLLRAQLLNEVVPLKSRIADRLFTDEERAVGAVTFIDPTTGIERTVPAAIPVAG